MSIRPWRAGGEPGYGARYVRRYGPAVRRRGHGRPVDRGTLLRIRSERFPGGSGSSGGRRSGQLADLSSRQRAVRCCAADVSVGSALGVGWRAELDGAVYGQPLVIGNQVIAATENDSVYALSALDGQVVWSVSLGQPMPGADGWTGRPRIPRSEVPARSLVIGPTPGQYPSASTGAWPHGVQRLGHCSGSLPC